MNHITHLTTRLTSLKRGGTKEGKAPHKPLLLLCFIDLIEEQKIKVNRIPVGKALFSLFSRHWRLLCISHLGSILMPLHHLKNDGLWRMRDKKGELITQKFSSKSTCEKEVAFGELEEGFFALLQEPEYRDYFRAVILDTYFQETKHYYAYVHTFPSYFQEAETVLLEDIEPKYTKETKEVQGYLRHWKFQSSLLRLYGNTCCISEFCLNPPFGIIQACHIIPHAEGGKHKITNGIALTANLHLAFDRGLISIDKQYRVLVDSKRFKEEGKTEQGILQYKGKELLLPPEDSFRPAQEYLAQHRERFGF